MESTKKDEKKSAIIGLMIFVGCFVLYIFLALVLYIDSRQSKYYDSNYIHNYWNDDFQTVISYGIYDNDSYVIRVVIPQSWTDNNECRVMVNRDFFVYNESDGAYYYNEIITKEDYENITFMDLVCNQGVDVSDYYSYEYHYDIGYSKGSSIELVKADDIDNLFDIIPKPKETTLDKADLVRNKYLSFVYISSTASTYYNVYKIKRIEFVNEKPNTDKSYNVAITYLPVEVSFDEDTGTLYFYSEADKIYLNRDSDYLFSNLPKLEEIKGIEKLSFDKVSYFSYLFQDSSIDKLELSNISIADTYSYGIFNYSKIGELTLRDINIMSKDFYSGLFSYAKIDKLNLDNLYLENVSSLESFFNGSEIGEINYINFDTSNISDMSQMFYGAKIKEVDLTSFDTSSLKKAEAMFAFSEIEKIDLSTFVFPNLVSYNFDDFFNGIIGLKYLDISSLDYSNFVDQKTTEPDRETIEDFFKGITEEVTVVVKDEKMKKLLINYVPKIKESNIIIKM